MFLRKKRKKYQFNVNSNLVPEKKRMEEIRILIYNLALNVYKY